MQLLQAVWQKLWRDRVWVFAINTWDERKERIVALAWEVCRLSVIFLDLT